MILVAVEQVFEDAAYFETPLVAHFVAEADYAVVVVVTAANGVNPAAEHTTVVAGVHTLTTMLIHLAG